MLAVTLHISLSTKVGYNKICGRIKGFQKGSTDAFQNGQANSIDHQYVDGISITLGRPRKHVWTYAAGSSDDYNFPPPNCPCANTQDHLLLCL